MNEQEICFWNRGGICSWDISQGVQVRCLRQDARTSSRELHRRTSKIERAGLSRLNETSSSAFPEKRSRSSWFSAGLKFQSESPKIALDDDFWVPAYFFYNTLALSLIKLYLRVMKLSRIAGG